MNITQITTVELEGAEKVALQKLKDAYMQCGIEDCFECTQCPLYVYDVCIGKCAEEILNKKGV